MRKSLKVGGLVLGVFAIVFTYYAVRAYGNKVTLDVRDMDLHTVLGKIEWQTWEKIYASTNITGKVTLKVDDVPLEEVLEIISQQTSARWMAIYPLYSSSKSLGMLKKALAGEVRASENGWNALSSRPMFGGFFAETARGQNKLVTLSLENKDIDVAAMALSRFAQAQVVPENGTQAKINLKFEQATMPEAVDALAQKARRKWTVLYSLEGFRRGGPEMGRRRPEGEGDSETNSWRGGTDGFGGDREAFSEEAQRRFEAQLATMTPEERQRAEEMRQRFQEMRNLTPEQRSERMREMASRPEFQQRMQSRMLNGIKNTTPEQRVERDQRMQRWRNESRRSN